MEIIDKVFFIPVLGILLLSLKCTTDKEDLSAIQCFSANHFGLGSIAIFMILILIYWCWLVQKFNFNFTFRMKDNLALHPTSINQFIYIFKVMLVCFRVFYGEKFISKTYITMIHIGFGVLLF